RADVDLRQAYAFEEYGLTYRIAEVGDFGRGLRHAGKGREFIHHAADVANLADDGVDALVEDLAVILQLAAIAAAQPFGRELDGRQRILDLVGDAAGHVGPGTGTLRRLEIGNVIEGQHIALGFGDRAFARQLHLVGAAVGFVAELYLIAHLPAPGRPRPFQGGRQLRHDLFDGLAHKVDFVPVQHFAGAGVDQGHGT